MIVADTDVLIDFLRGKGKAERVAFELGTGTLATTAITVFELGSGARTKRQRASVDALLGALRVLRLDAEAAERAAAVRVALEGRGEKIGMADYLIAGICLSHGAVLLTRNLDHFRRIEGLKLSGELV